MSDRLYFSAWVRGFNESNMLRHYAKLLEHFPFSKLSSHSLSLRIYAAEYAEPPVAEKPFEPGTTAADILAAAREFTRPDCVVELDAWWDLWRYDAAEPGNAAAAAGWNLAPSAVTLSCFGPEFLTETGDNLRIDFGLDAKFLPLPGIEGSLRMQQSNLRSLLHLTSELEKALPLSRRQLWSESGANFAELLAKAVEDYTVN